MRKHLLDYIDVAKTDSVRGLRILVEYFYALDIFRHAFESKMRVVSVFGSARSQPDNAEYQRAKKLGRLLYENGFGVVTGASQGIMQAAGEGVHEGVLAKMKEKQPGKDAAEIIKTSAYRRELKRYSLGLKISLPFEEESNAFLGVVATFHYFMVRKFFFATLSSAFIACEGGWGTRDELFEMMTLVQTGKSPLMPIIYLSPNARHLQADIDFALKSGYIAPEDLYLIQIVSDHCEAVDIIKKFYSVVRGFNYEIKDVIEIFVARPLNAAQKKRVLTLVNGRFKKYFQADGVVFFNDKIVLKKSDFRSFGVIRRIIDVISTG